MWVTLSGSMVMSDVIRAFVAICVAPSPALRGILDDLASLGRAVKPVAIENLHLTVKFLGNTDPVWISGVEKVLQEIAASTPEFDVALQGLGAFPSPSRPLVIWTGMTPSEVVSRLASDVESALVRFGFAAETRPFHPHVTLARIKTRPSRELAGLLERHPETEFATFPVRAIVLMQSQLTPSGPRYTPVNVATLRGPFAT
ncbi:MAG: RNA 2',3'-cyclic phosphodiesterase [Planctomycetaceae bacterium]|nr:RNA 2',3'-cyclic phosphodiesterase [Planctomycetaceae bacterium]